MVLVTPVLVPHLAIATGSAAIPAMPVGPQAPHIPNATSPLLLHMSRGLSLPPLFAQETSHYIHLLTGLLGLIRRMTHPFLLIVTAPAFAALLVLMAIATALHLQHRVAILPTVPPTRNANLVFLVSLTSLPILMATPNLYAPSLLVCVAAGITYSIT